MEKSGTVQWHELDPKDALEKLDSSEKGLSEKEAAQRLEKFGPNELAKAERISPMRLFFNQFTNFLVLILIFATIFSFAIGEVVDAIAILIILVLNAVFGFLQEYRADKAIEALKKLTSPESIVMREGRKEKIPSSQLVPGDVVIIEEGTRIPADLRLLETVNLRIDEASLTGESSPVGKDFLFRGKAQVPDRKNMCFAGTYATYGHGSGVAVATAMGTEVGKIASLLKQAEKKETPLQKKLRVFGKNLGILIMVISVIVIVGGILRSYPVTDMILTGIALAVAAIPEGLPAIVTITLALGLRRLANQNALLRNLPAAETLGSTSVICSDKTGTLTKNEMTVTNIWYQGKEIEVTGHGYDKKGEFLLSGKKFSKDADFSLLLKAGALCNNASFERGSLMGDPTEGAILVAALKAGEPLSSKRIDEIPFSSERKMMSTVNLVGTKQLLFCKGAPEMIVQRCSKIQKNGKAVFIGRKERQQILQQNLKMTGDALRVLGVAYKPVNGRKDYKETGLVFLGLMGMIDPPRPEVKSDIALCQAAGIKTVMITGDHRNTALAIAKSIGLYREGELTLTGEELEKLSDQQFRKIVEKISVYARVSPSHKVRIVEALRKNGHVAAMTGDGVNDAPALKKSDIGVAMGIKGTDVAKEASDMILTDDRYSSIVSAVREGRQIYDNILTFIRYLLSSNIAEVLVVFLALLIFYTPGEVVIPLLAVQLLWINLVTDGLPALALGIDPPTPDIMSRLPRNPKEKLLSRHTLSFILWTGAIITLGTLWVFWSELPFGIEKAQTMAFTTIVMFEMFNVFNSRGFVRRKWFGLLENKKLVLAVLSSVILQLVVIYVPFLQVPFSTVSLGLQDWAKILGVSLSVLVVMGIKEKLKK